VVSEVQKASMCAVGARLHPKVGALTRLHGLEVCDSLDEALHNLKGR